MLEILDIDQSSDWDKIVQTFEKCEVYYLSGYVKGLMKHGDGSPLLFSYSDANGRAINVTMMRDVSTSNKLVGRVGPGTLFDLSTPYGYGGWLIEGSPSLGQLFAQYDRYCLNAGIVCEFVRFHPLLDNAKAINSIYSVEYLGPTVAVDLSSKDAIWSNFTSKNRNVIRKAKKMGVEIGHGSSLDLYKSFKSLYEATMLRDQADPYYYFGDSYYESVANDLAEHSEVFYATYDGQMIAAAIILFSNKTLNYHLSGSNYKYRNLAPTNLLLYEASCWGLENGCTKMHLGGGLGAQEDSLYKFKKSFFRGTPLNYSIGKRIIDDEVYRQLTRIANNPHSSFFPSYRE